MKKVLSQNETAGVFQAFTAATEGPRSGQPEVDPFDFNRLDRIPRSQLQSLHLVHENFVRNLASSLSAYLRSYVALNLVSLEQISYAEFLAGLASPTCVAYLGLSPYDTTGVLELSTNLVFALLELLLGSKGRSTITLQRKITDIEKRLVQTLLRVVLRDLSEAWKSVAEIQFSVRSLASEPELLQLLAPAEAVIVIAVEVRVGSNAGLMNLAIPSIFVKRLRNRFEQVQKIRKVESTQGEQRHIAKLLENTKLTLEVQIPGGTIPAKTLLGLDVDDVLILDHPTSREITGMLNNKDKWMGNIVTRNDRLAFEFTEYNCFPASNAVYSPALT